MVQQSVVRFIISDYSYNSSATSTLNRPTLQNHRINFRAIHKIVNNLNGIPADSFLLQNSSCTHHCHHSYIMPYSRIRAHLPISFFPFSIKIWNHLSPHTACSPCLKKGISKENLTTRLTLS